MSSAWADEIPAPAKSSAKFVTSADVIQWLLALVLVLGVFLLLVLMLKKSGCLATAGKSKLTVLAGLSLGMREKLVLVRVGEKELLLGVSNGRIDKLLELEGEQRLFSNQDQSQDLGPFAQKLLQAIQGKTHEQA